MQQKVLSLIEPLFIDSALKHDYENGFNRRLPVALPSPFAIYATRNITRSPSLH